MLQAIIFDYDGTIAATTKRQESWFRFYSAKNGKDWRFSSFDEFMSFYNVESAKMGNVQNVYDALGLPCDMKDRSHPVWPAFEEFNTQNPADLYPGMKEAVESIWKNGQLSKDAARTTRLRLAINTSNSWRSVYSDLDRAGILPYFDSFVTEEVLRRYHGAGNCEPLKKPSTISLSLMLDLLSCDGADVLHIGDTLDDLRASKDIMRLGRKDPESLVTVGACYGYLGRQKLSEGIVIGGKETHFDYLIDHPSELVDIVKRLQ